MENVYVATETESSTRIKESAPHGDVRWLSIDEQKAWRAFLYTTTRLRDQLSQALEQDPRINLSLAEYEILVRLSEYEGHRVRMSELAEHVVHSRSRLTHTISRLACRGLVARERCQADGRGREAVLTSHGQALLEYAAPLHVRSVRSALIDPMGEEDFLRLGSILSQLLTDDDRLSVEKIGEEHH